MRVAGTGHGNNAGDDVQVAFDALWLLPVFMRTDSLASPPCCCWDDSSLIQKNSALRRFVPVMSMTIMTECLTPTALKSNSNWFIAVYHIDESRCEQADPNLEHMEISHG